MKILSIQIKNLAAIEDAIIDFTKEPIASAGLYAITGATGAGKSTILDALCLALYNQAPRYKAARAGALIDISGKPVQQNDPVSILRDGCGYGYSLVQFVGIDGITYQSKWEINRARNKANGKLQDETITLTEFVTQQNYPGKNTETLLRLKEIIGLTYEQFTKAVLLSQGEFAAFLKATDADRSELLEKLTGTEIYSQISKNIYLKNKAVETQLNVLKVELEQYQLLDETAITSINNTIENNNKASNEISNKIIRCNKQIEWLEQLDIANNTVEAAITTLNTIIIEQQNFTTLKQELDIYNTVKPINMEYNKYIENKSKLIDSQNNLIALETKLVTQQTNLVATLKKLQELQIQLETKKEAIVTAQPLLQQARELDITLIEKNKIYNKDLADANTKQAELNNNKENLAKLILQFNKAQAQITQANTFLETNKSKQSIAEQIVLIKEKLEQYKSIEQNLKVYTISNETAVQKQNKIVDEINAIEIELPALNRYKTALEDELKNIEQNLKDIDRDYLQKQYNTNAETITVLEIAALKIEEINSSEQYLARMQSSTQIAQVRLEEREKIEQLIKLELAEALGQKNALEVSYEKIKEQISESISKLRNALLPNEPCTVCGSKEHPFVKEHFTDNILAEAKARLDKAISKYEEILKTQTDCKVKIREHAILIAINTQEIYKMQPKLKKAKAAFEEIIIKSKLINNTTTIADVIDFKKIILDQQLALQDQLFTSKNSIDKAETLKQKVLSIVNKITESKNEMDKLQITLSNNVEKITASKNEINNLQNNKILLASTIDNLFNSNQWQKSWVTDPTKLVADVQLFATNWQQNIAHKQNAEKVKDGLQIEINNATANVNSQQTAIEKLQHNLQEQATYIAEQVGNRKQYFEGKELKIVEQQLAQAVLIVENLVQEKDTQKQAIEKEITVLSTNKTTAVNNVESIIAENKKLLHTLDSFLVSNNNISLQNLQSIFSKTMEYYNDIQNKANSLLQQHTTAKAIVEERTNKYNQIAQLALTTATPEQLVQALQAFTEQNIVLQNHIGSLQQQLAQNTSNESIVKNKKITLDTLQVSAKQLGILDKLIGSQSGAKFRAIAQQYTLDILLAYANAHMQELYKRYELQRIPNTLSLQIVDKDMANDVRTIYSLSGGETFLTSLALALGLSSLSSNNMIIENLFIDEGFGALDAATLQTAMQALDHLHAQGRKVGVITHVQEMIENIPVQIQVQKNNSGKSVVEIIG